MKQATSGIHATHETRNGALCTDLYETLGRSHTYLRDDERRTDRVYHKCAFGPYTNPRYEWVNVGNLREYKP